MSLTLSVALTISSGVNPFLALSYASHHYLHSLPSLFALLILSLSFDRSTFAMTNTYKNKGQHEEGNKFFLIYELSF